MTPFQRGEYIMARVVLPFAKRSEEVVPLPPVCIRCGKPATRTLKMQFSGRVTKFLGIRIYSPGGGDEYVVVDTPLCDGHPFMGQFKWILLIGFVLLLPFFALGAITKPWIHHYVVAFPLIAIVIVGFAFAIYVLLTSIDGEGFDEKGVTATRVSPKFVQALKDHGWTDDEFMAEVRKNRKGRVKPKKPIWISPYFYVPVGFALAFGIFSPLGFLVASMEEYGTWPAGTWAKRKPGEPGGGPEQQGGPQDVPKQPEAFNPKSLDGLVGYWPLDDGQGNAAQDASGNGILAFLHGGQWVQGFKGQALRLNGKSDYLDLGPASNHLSFGDGQPFTVACWVNTTADSGVISAFRGKDKILPAVVLFVRDGKVRGRVRDDTAGQGGGALPEGGPINDGKWRHVALVRQPDGTVELYLDGIFQAKEKGKNSAGPITTQHHTVGSDRFVVEHPRRPGPAYFDGSIDEFCVFKRALSGDDIAVLTGGKK
jgi:hypothetical protein